MKMETSPILATDGRRGATKIMQLSNGQWAHTSGTNILSNSDLLSTFYNKYSIKKCCLQYPCRLSFVYPDMHRIKSLSNKASALVSN